MEAKAMSCTYKCGESPGMEVCPASLAVGTQEELWRHIELHASLAHGDDPLDHPDTTGDAPTGRTAGRAAPGQPRTGDRGSRRWRWRCRRRHRCRPACPPPTNPASWLTNQLLPPPPQLEHPQLPPSALTRDHAAEGADAEPCRTRGRQWAVHSAAPAVPARYHPSMAMNLRLSDAEAEALRRKAEQEGRSMQEVARAAIAEYVSDRPARLRAAIDRVRREDEELLERLSR